MCVCVTCIQQNKKKESFLESANRRLKQFDAFLGDKSFFVGDQVSKRQCCELFSINTYGFSDRLLQIVEVPSVVIS